MTEHRLLVSVGVVALIVGLAVSMVALDDFDGDPSGLARFSISSSEYAEPLVGEVVISPGAGHDGKFFFELANDPWLLDPREHAFWLDDPPYRAQRILYPMLAGGFGLLPPPIVLWSLIGVNVLALAGGSVALGDLARQQGASPWLGLAFVANPGMVFELLIDGSSIVAAALAFGGLALLGRERRTGAAGLLALSVLARETMILLVVGGFVFDLWRRRRPDLRLIVAPAVLYGTWTAWMRWRLRNLEPRFSAAERNLTVPFGDVVEAVGAWIERGRITTAVGLFVVVCCLIVVGMVWRKPSLLSWSAAPMAVLPVVLSAAVLTEPFDVTRSVAPALSAAIVLLMAAEGLPAAGRGLDRGSLVS